MTKRDPFRYFKTSRKIIRLAVMLSIWFPLSLRNVEDMLRERGIDLSYETVRRNTRAGLVTVIFPGRKRGTVRR